MRQEQLFNTICETLDKLYADDIAHYGEPQNYYTGALYMASNVISRFSTINRIIDRNDGKHRIIDFTK